MSLRAVLALLALAAFSVPAAGQDVELLSERYGTPLPDGYYETRAANPTAFEFSTGRTARLRALVQQPGAAQLLGGPASALGPRTGVVRGTFRVPVVLGLFFDTESAGPYAREVAQAAFFNEGPAGIQAYYREVSGGRLTLRGEVMGWVRSDRTKASATLGESGLITGTVGPFILDLLSKVQGVDWGAYDNDGPDGVPNSGDDDGLVDVLGVVHPTNGAECGGTDKADRIWSHKWSLSSAVQWPIGTPSANRTFQTTAPAANGGFIRIDDYFVTPIFSCGGSSINEIGVMTHEIGHAFGLPDLYDTNDGNGKHQGAGYWDLMASGAWGCDGQNANVPCHMGAWSKSVLGWVSVVPYAAAVDHGVVTLPPVGSSGVVYRVEAGDNSGEYFLLENRRKVGFDQRLPAEGLLVWQVRPSLLTVGWPLNRVNANEAMGVWLRQADGRNDLGVIGGANKGDSGDVFPYAGSSGENRAFHAGSNPSSRSRNGTATGVTILDIQRTGADVRLRLLTRFTSVSVRTEGSAGTGGGLFTVNGAPIVQPAYTFSSAPFEVPVLEAAVGETISSGVRRPFVGWDDDPSAPRRRSFVTPLANVSLVARYSGRQNEVSLTATGGVNGASPGTFLAEPTSSDFWFAEGTSVRLEARPRTGYAFTGWTGGLAGQPNPVTLSVNAPVTATADFTVSYAVVATTVRLPAAAPQDTSFSTVNGTNPVAWTLVSGRLPEGLSFTSQGRVQGSALEAGIFPVTLEARDATGLSARGTVTLETTAPVLGAAELTSIFLRAAHELSADQERFVDWQGNRDGVYDLGDFRAWVMEHPGLAVNGGGS